MQTPDNVSVSSSVNATVSTLPAPIAATTTHTLRPAAGTRVVLAFRKAGGDLFPPCDGPCGGQQYWFEIRNDGTIWGHTEGGYVMGFRSDDTSPTTTEDIGGALQDFTQNAQVAVALGLWEIFNPDNGEALEELPACAWLDGEFHVAIPGTPEFDALEAKMSAAQAAEEAALA
jgi:hypothetical protein